MSSNVPEIYRVFLLPERRIKENRMISKTKLKPTKDSLKNKRLIKILNHKIFKGFHKTKKLSYLSKHPIHVNPHLQTPLHLWEEYEPYFFEDNYNITYKQRYLSALNGPNLSDNYQIKHFSPSPPSHNTKPTKLMKNLFMTATKEKKTVDKSTNTFYHKEPSILDRIFPDKNEMKNYSSLEFFSIYKNPDDNEKSYANKTHNGIFHSRTRNYQNKYKETNFLYKISHHYNNEDKMNNNNNVYPLNQINHNNKGITYNNFFTASPIPKNNHKYNNNKVKLQLNLQNSALRKVTSQQLLTSDERDKQFINTNMKILKDGINNTFSKLEMDFFSEDDNNETNYQNNVSYQNSCIANNTINNNTDNKILNKGNNKYSKGEIKPNITNNNKSIRIATSNDNISTEASQKHRYLTREQKHKERFNFIKNMAFSSDENAPKQKKKPIISLKGLINKNQTLYKQVKHTYQAHNNKMSKLRDTQISLKLKPHFNQNDINRLLNGKKPFLEE